ncbi:MAG: NRDE family protein [Stenotrophobium sp.]
MCLISFTWRAHPRHALVLAANRDEFHDRPTAAANWWADAPDVFGGRDLSQGGGWLALSRRNRLAAVTNVRRMVPLDPAAPSRGKLVADFMRGTQSAADFATALTARAGTYAGFNLLLYDGDELIYANNHPVPVWTRVEPGVHGLSNAALDTPWPKLRRLRQQVADWTTRDEADPLQLFAPLSDQRPAPDAELPDTGVGIEMERFLSSAFIRSARYGTRCSTVLTFDAAGPTFFAERRFSADGKNGGETRETFGRDSK